MTSILRSAVGLALAGSAWWAWRQGWFQRFVPAEYGLKARAPRSVPSATLGDAAGMSPPDIAAF